MLDAFTGASNVVPADAAGSIGVRDATFRWSAAPASRSDSTRSSSTGSSIDVSSGGSTAADVVAAVPLGVSL